MEYRRFGNKIVMRLDKGDEITQFVKALAEKEDINLACVSGIGATDDFTIGVFDLNESAYNRFSFGENHEITSLTGNINTKDGKKYVHLHITCASDGGKIVGGHLLNGVISLTAEIFIDIIDGKVDRIHNDELNINTLNFDV